MKTIPLILSAFLVFFTACSKDSFETKPTLTVKSVNSKSLDQGEDFVANLEYTDKEGDVDNVIYVIRQRVNKLGQRTVSDDYTVPEFPNNDKGDIEVVLRYSFELTAGFTAIPMPGNQKQPDTMNIKFVLKDRASNLSDTAIVSNVIIRR